MTVTAEPPEVAEPPDVGQPESAERPEPRFVRQDKGSREPDADDPDEEDVFAGWRTIETWEWALFLGTFIVALLIWNIFIFVHGAWRWPFG